VGVTTAVGLVAPGLAGAAVSAPADIISFPARDFVSAIGYKLSDLYTVEVQHPDGRVVGAVTDVAPKDDREGGGLGIIEVNHPGVVLPSTESTIFENGAAAIAGPSAPCTAPLEKLPPPPGSETTPPSDVAGLTGSASNTTVTLNWNAATGNVDVTDYGIYRTDATGVTTAIATVQNPDGSNNPPTTFTDQNVAPGTYTSTPSATAR
jgi:hypothetical protein